MDSYGFLCVCAFLFAYSIRDSFLVISMFYLAQYSTIVCGFFLSYAIGKSNELIARSMNLVLKAHTFVQLFGRLA